MKAERKITYLGTKCWKDRDRNNEINLWYEEECALKVEG